MNIANDKSIINPLNINKLEVKHLYSKDIFKTRALIRIMIFVHNPKKRINLHGRLIFIATFWYILKKSYGNKCTL